MDSKKQIHIINSILGKQKPKGIEKHKWTRHDEESAFKLYALKACGDLIDIVAEDLGIKTQSMHMKLANIDSIRKGNNTGLNHVSKLTVDVFNTRKHLLRNE